MSLSGVASHRDQVEHAYRAYGHSVRRRARKLLGDEQEASDVMQEVFTSLLGRPQQFEGRSAMATYLYAMTTHACLNRLRNRRTREALRDQRAASLEPARAQADPDVAVALREVLAALDPEEATAAVHHYLDGMSHAEIADILGCSRRRVGDLLDRMRARLTLAAGIARREAR